MLALAHPVQSPDPPMLSRTPSSSSASSRTRTDAYREWERGSERVQSQSYNLLQVPQPSGSNSHQTPPSLSQTRSPTLHPHDHAVEHPFILSRPEAYRMEAITEAEKACIEIHNFPSADLLRLLASLLQEIAFSNDRLYPPPFPPYDSLPIRSPASSPSWLGLTTASRDALSTSTSSLSFHARHIPSITLEAYLLRILKYCPTTNEVFLSLLVYFDRMSKLSNEATHKDFIIDSYNIHRLVIAGVTVASKFFSDVFYTNSRYAKVGGLPHAELNQLELQFLLLNDFQLDIPPEEMQKYAVQLIAYSRGSNPTLVAPLIHLIQPPVTSNSPVASNPFISPFDDGVSGEHLNGTDDVGEADDTEDETIRPSHSSGPSETSSLLTAQSDADEEEAMPEAIENIQDDRRAQGNHFMVGRRVIW